MTDPHTRFHPPFGLYAAAGTAIVLPAALTVAFPSRFPPGLLALFYLAGLSLSVLLTRRNVREIEKRHIEIEALRERMNLLNEENGREQLTTRSLHRRIERYADLKKTIELLNQDLALESVADQLCAIAFHLVAGNQGQCLLYLVDAQTQSMRLFRTLKDERNLPAKSGQGDMFDHWVARHAQPLLVEDTAADFRFDAERIAGPDRQISSLVSAPLVSGTSLLGVLRLEHPQRKFFNQDDQRFLSTIAELGAVSLENSLFYRDTQELAIHDGLTGLFNKGYFLERLKAHCQDSIGHGRRFCLLMIDIDYFKKLNDTFGHPAGDVVLVAVSGGLQKELEGRQGCIGRFGGEEFCVLLPDTRKKDALIAAEAMRRAIASLRLHVRNEDTRCTVSIGVAEFPIDGVDEFDLIMQADRALYDAKGKGRNLVIGA